MSTNSLLDWAAVFIYHFMFMSLRSFVFIIKFELFGEDQQSMLTWFLLRFQFYWVELAYFSQKISVNIIHRYVLLYFHWQSQSDGESHRSNMEKEDTRSSPSPPSTPSICSPPSSASSVPSTGKNVCASCGLEILDRYLLKVRARDCICVCLCVCRLVWRVNCFDMSLSDSLL